MNKIVKKYEQPGEYQIQLEYDKVGMRQDWLGVVKAETKGEYELSVRIEHTVPNTEGRVGVRAIARNGARVKLSGLIRIAKEAQGTDSYLELRVLLLDPQSRAMVDPQLEIEANEVKAGHGASVSKIDEKQIEYLMSRGIAREQAESEIVEGWLMVE